MITIIHQEIFITSFKGKALKSAKESAKPFAKVLYSCQV